MAQKPSQGSTTRGEWLSVFAPPITRRLNGVLPGANLTNSDIVNLMSLCGFDTAAKNGAPSPWCNVFTPQEWKSNQYYYDLEVRFVHVSWLDHTLCSIMQVEILFLRIWLKVWSI